MELCSLRRVETEILKKKKVGYALRPLKKNLQSHDVLALAWLRIQTRSSTLSRPSPSSRRTPEAHWPKIPRLTELFSQLHKCASPQKSRRCILCLRLLFPLPPPTLFAHRIYCTHAYIHTLSWPRQRQLIPLSVRMVFVDFSASRTTAPSYVPLAPVSRPFYSRHSPHAFSYTNLRGHRLTLFRSSADSHGCEITMYATTAIPLKQSN